MRYSEVIGLDHIKRHLQRTVSTGRLAHAQLFSGSTGSGILPLAISYARQIICSDNVSDSCEAQIDALSHPDLHFGFPVAPIAGVKKPTSNDFLAQWREFVLSNPYGGIYDWHRHIGIEKKQGLINVHEAKRIQSALSLKSFSGGYKVMIIYGAEFMNTEASNKLLKLIEEPPERTIFLLLAENQENVINTIRSRCQLLDIPKLSVPDIANGLSSRSHVASEQIQLIARRADGNFRRAQLLLLKSGADKQFERWFITWIRAAFKAGKNKNAVAQLVEWSEQLSSEGRETQKQFLDYCSEFFRQALLYNYRADSAVYFAPSSDGFSLENFAPYISGHNIEVIFRSLDDATYHIERNANPKIIFTDLALNLTRMLHRKP